MKRFFKICIVIGLLFALLLPVSAKPYERGDVNGDGRVNALDYAIVKRSVTKKLTLNDAQKKSADVNGDNRVNAIDYMLIKRVVMKVGTFPCLHDYREQTVGNLHIFTCKTCGHQYEKFDGELIG